MFEKIKLLKKFISWTKTGGAAEFYFPHVEEMMAGIENKKLELACKE